MNRREVLKKILGTTTAVIVVPHILLEEIPIVPEVIEAVSPPPLGNEGLWVQLKKGKCVQYGQGLTREHIKEAMEYVFNERTTPREVKFQASKKTIKTMHSYILNGVTYTT